MFRTGKCCERLRGLVGCVGLEIKEVQSNEHGARNSNKFLGRGIVFRKSGKHLCY
jgi:hypothetical protein